MHCFLYGKNTFTLRTQVNIIVSLNELPLADQVPLLDEQHQPDPNWIQCKG